MLIRSKKLKRRRKVKISVFFKRKEIMRFFKYAIRFSALFITMWMALISSCGIAMANEAIDDLQKLDKIRHELQAEVKNQQRVIKDMQKILNASYEPGGVAPNISRLHPMGQAGIGVVGAGKNKPQSVKDVINKYESISNPQNWVGAIRLMKLSSVKKKLIEKYKKEHGVSDNEQIDMDALEKINRMAEGRVVYNNEIARSKELVSRLRVKVKEVDQKRTSILKIMGEKEREEYERLHPLARQAVEEPKEKKDKAPVDDKKPLYDATDLRTAFAVLKKQIREENKNLSKILASCEKMKTKEQVDSWIEKILKSKLPEPKKMREVLLKDKKEIALLEAVRYELEQLVSSTRNKASQECQNASNTSLSIDAGKTISFSLQNSVTIAEQWYEKANNQGNKVISLLSDNSKIPSPKSYLDELNLESTRLVGECSQSVVPFDRLSSSLYGNLYRRTQTTYVKIDSGLKRAKYLLEEAKKARYEHSDIYQHRYQEALSLVKKIKINHEKIEQCNNRYNYILNRCSEFGKEHKYKNSRKFMYYEYQLLWVGIMDLRKEQLAKVKSGMQDIAENKEQVIKAVEGAKNCLKAAQAKEKQKGPSPVLIAEAAAVKVSCNRGANSANIAKLNKSRFSKVPGIGKKISDLRRVNSALSQEASASADAVRSYRNGKANDAIAALNRAQTALDSIGSLLRCPVIKTKIRTRKAKAKQLRTVLARVDSAISGCRRGELKKVLGLYGKDTHPVLKKKMSHVREQLQLLQKFLEAGDAYRSNKIDLFVKIMHQVNGKGAPLSCPRLDKKAQRKIDMIDRAKNDKTRVRGLAATCDIKALRKLQRRYRKESGVITLAKEIYESATEAMKNCKRKERERRAKAKEEARAKAQKAKEEAEARAKAEAAAREKAKKDAEAKAKAEVRKAKKEAEARAKAEAEAKKPMISGSWQGDFETKCTVQGLTNTIKGVLIFSIKKGRVRGQIGKGKNSVPIKGRVNNGHIQMQAVQHGGDGEQIKITLRGKILDNGTVKGKGSYTQPEWECVAEELGKMIGGGKGGRRCPMANYPTWWSAHKVEPPE